VSELLHAVTDGRSRKPVDWATLESYGVAHPRFAICETLDQAITFLRASHAAAVCLKGITQSHKMADGLVALDIRSEKMLETEWERLGSNSRALGLGKALMIQDQVNAGLEVIVGAKRDPVFGPVIILGIGGVLAEFIKRIEVRLLPVSDEQAMTLVSQAIGRTEPRLTQMVMAISRLFGDHPEVRELDLNPVILTTSGPLAVDLRVIEYGAEETLLSQARPDSRPYETAAAAIGRMVAPESIAIIGASADPGKPGGTVLRYLHAQGFDDRLHLVHPRGGEIGGLMAVRSIDELPQGIDVAVIATSAPSVTESLSKCADRGIPAAIVFGSGFKEVGNVELEATVQGVARQRGIRLCGVNSIGIVGDAPLTFSRALDYPDPVPGTVSFITQSGALGGSLLVRSWTQRLGTARFICVGNQTDLTIADYLRFLAHDSKTRTVGVFVEGVEDGRDFGLAIKEVTAAGKGLVALRTGVTAAGSAAALSHTGALAGLDELYEQVIADNRGVRVSDLPELVAACQTLDWQPRPRGPRIGIIATSGGAGSLLADGALAHGLTLAEWTEPTRQVMRETLPDFAVVNNPIDTTGHVLKDPSLVGRLLAVVADSTDCDIILVAISTLMGAAAWTVAVDIVGIGKLINKPIVVAWSLPESACGDAYSVLREARVPVFDSYSVGLVAAGALVR